MTPHLSIRMLFYLAEAAALAVPLALGLVLAKRAFRRWGRAFPALTWKRMAVLILGLTIIDAALAESLGPQVIVQYYVAALTLAVGACLWLLSRAVTTLAAGRRSP